MTGGKIAALGNQYKIGTNHSNLALWNALATPVPDPYAGPMDYAEPTEMADGSISLLGWIEQDLHWGVLTEAQANQVRVFAGDVNIYTLKNDGNLGEFTGKLIWPIKEPEHKSNNVLDLTVKVIQLTAV